MSRWLKPGTSRARVRKFDTVYIIKGDAVNAIDRHFEWAARGYRSTYDSNIVSPTQPPPYTPIIDSSLLIMILRVYYPDCKIIWCEHNSVCDLPAEGHRVAFFGVKPANIEMIIERSKSSWWFSTSNGCDYKGISDHTNGSTKFNIYGISDREPTPRSHIETAATECYSRLLWSWITQQNVIPWFLSMLLDVVTHKHIHYDAPINAFNIVWAEKLGEWFSDLPRCDKSRRDLSRRDLSRRDLSRRDLTCLDMNMTKYVDRTVTDIMSSYDGIMLPIVIEGTNYELFHVIYFDNNENQPLLLIQQLVIILMNTMCDKYPNTNIVIYSNGFITLTRYPLLLSIGVVDLINSATIALAPADLPNSANYSFTTFERIIYATGIPTRVIEFALFGECVG